MIERFYTTGHKIRRYTTGTDAYGDPAETWADHLSLSGKLFPLQGDERQSADKQTYFARYGFRCGLANITEKDRYVDPSGLEYDIKEVAPRLRPDGTGHLALVVELRR